MAWISERLVISKTNIASNFDHVGLHIFKPGQRSGQCVRPLLPERHKMFVCIQTWYSGNPVFDYWIETEQVTAAIDFPTFLQ